MAVSQTKELTNEYAIELLQIQGKKNKNKQSCYDKGGLNHLMMSGINDLMMGGLKKEKLIST